MIFCPKCGFKNEQPQATDCPKCGLVYAKFHKAKNEGKNHIAAEQELTNSFRRAMSSEVEEATDFIDLETRKDADSYQMLNYLSLFFICFAAILAIFTLVEAKYIWGLLNYLSASYKMFTTSDKWLIAISVFFIGTMQVALFLAVGGLLRIGKDIADNTRATRNYLLHIARKC